MAGRAKKGKKRTEPRGLSSRQMTFCQKYFEHGNARQAYIEAGLPGEPLADPTLSGTIDNAAYRLLKYAQVKAYLLELEEDACHSIRITVARLARGYNRAEQLDIVHIIGKDGFIKPPDKWPKVIRLCLQRFEVKELFEIRKVDGLDEKVRIGTEWKVWFENRTECRNMLAKWKRMISDDEELKRQGAEIDELKRLLTVKHDKDQNKKGTSGGTEGDKEGTPEEKPSRDSSSSE